MLFWLGHVLDHAGFQAFPAKSVPDAASLLAELHLTISVLIVDCCLPGAEDLITNLRRSKRFLKVICLGGDTPHTCARGVDAVCRRPDGFSERSKARWVRAVREVLSASAVA